MMGVGLTKINDPVRLSDGSISTIRELDAQARVSYVKIDNFRGRRGAMRTVYLAELESGDSWEISKGTYERKQKAG